MLPLTLTPLRSLPPCGLRFRHWFAQNSWAVDAASCCTLPTDIANKISGRAEPQVFNVTGDVHLHARAEGRRGQPVQWDAVAITPEAKALLQKHAVKAVTALKMQKILGFEDVDDIPRLSPDLISRLKLKPLQLAPLLSMLRDQRRPQRLPQQLSASGSKDPKLDAEGQPGQRPPLQWYQVQQQQEPPQQQCQQQGLHQQHFTQAEDRPLAELAGGADPVDRMHLATPEAEPGPPGAADPAPECGATHTCVAVLEGHAAKVRCVAITPDGRRALSSSMDGTLRLWDLQAHACLALLEGHAGTICCVAIAPDGRHAVAGGSDRKLRLWDLDTHTCIASMEGHTDWIWTVAVTPDGRHAVSGSSDRQLRVWDLAERACVGAMEGHAEDVSCVAVTPDGRAAVSGGDDCTLRVWDLVGRTCVATLGGGGRAGPGGGGQRAAASRSRGKEEEDEEKQQPGAQSCDPALGGHTRWVTSVAITPDGRHAISGSHDTTLRVWDLSTNACIAVLEGHAESICFVTITPDGRHAVSGSSDRKLLVWDLAAHACVATLKGHAHCVAGVAMAADGLRAVSGGDDHALRVWDLEPNS